MRAFLNGAHIMYVDSGKAGAAPVVFLHGFPFSHEMWLQQMQIAGREFRTIAYDIRGHGMSDVGDGQYTIESHVNDLMALLEHLKAERPVLVGLSMGGYIALRALERHPGSFRAAVLCDTRSEADSNEGKVGRAAAMVTVKKHGSAAFAEEFVKKVFAPASLASRAEAVALIKRTISRTPPLSLAGTLLALAARTDTTAALPGISVPTLILVGEHDTLTPPEASRAMQARIPGSELHVVPAAAHMSNLENPEFFNDRLMAFLRRVAAA